MRPAEDSAPAATRLRNSITGGMKQRFGIAQALRAGPEGAQDLHATFQRSIGRRAARFFVEQVSHGVEAVYRCATVRTAH